MFLQTGGVTSKVSTTIRRLPRRQVFADLEKIGYLVPFFSLTVYKLRQLPLEKYQAYLDLFDRIYKGINFAPFITKPKLYLVLPSVKELMFMNLELLKQNEGLIRQNFFVANKMVLDLRNLPALHRALLRKQILTEIPQKADR